MICIHLYTTTPELIYIVYVENHDKKSLPRENLESSCTFTLSWTSEVKFKRLLIIFSDESSSHTK